MKIWIDLSNSPHALLFEPLVPALREKGHEVLLTARDNAQTVELARQRWPEAEVIGGESPSSRAGKAASIARRVYDLIRWARARRPDVAFSHNSYAQILAAKASGIAIVTAMDFEHQPANPLAFRLADLVLLPEALRSADLARQGARPGKTRYYPGLKEELYLGNFTPDASVVRSLGIDESRQEMLVVARTPPSRALYHGFENPLFLDAIKRAATRRATRVIVLTRFLEQREALAGLGLDQIQVPREAVDSRSLMHASDLVIGAGGTMTREAALLGVPTYSVFAGKTPAVDAWLQERGMLRRLTHVHNLVLEPRREDPRGDAERRQRSELLIPHFTAAATLAPAPAPVSSRVQRPALVASGA